MKFRYKNLLKKTLLIVVGNVAGEKIAALACKAGILNIYIVSEILLLNKKYKSLEYILKNNDNYPLLALVSSKNELMALKKISNGFPSDSKNQLRDLKSLSAFFTKTGFFKLAWWCRVKSHINILKNGNCRPEQIDQIAFEIATIGYDKFKVLVNGLYLCLDQFEDIEERILLFSNDFQAGLHHLKKMSEEIVGNEIGIYVEKKGVFYGEHVNFINYIVGKNILIIGPSVYDSNTFIKKVKHDVVGRIGYTGEDSISVAKTLGVDLSFYKDYKLSDIISNKKEVHVGEALYSCIGANTSIENINKISDNSRLIVSKFSGPILAGSGPNAGLEFVLMLIDSGAKKVFISNIDLFLGKFYPSGYIFSNSIDEKISDPSDVSEIEGKKICRSFVNHFPVAQYSTFYWLWRNNKIEGDAVFSSLMENGLDEYLVKLSDTYSPVKLMS